MLATFASLLASGRVLLGLAPIVAADPLARLLGFPQEHLTPSTRLFARLFGVRDIGLGVLVFAALPQLELLRLAFLFNLATDLADASMIAIPLLRRQGISRPARLCLAMALLGGSGWLLAWLGS